MKKIMKKSGILFLALLLVCTAAVIAGGTQNVSAKAVKAKKLKMKKKNVSVTVGKTVKLGVSVNPQKAKVTWSSNKKKIATVSKRGVVKGIKKGTAKITAKSGKKKATCTVKVKEVPAGIKAVSVLSMKGIRVTLTKAYALGASDFTVKKKSNAKGSFNTTLKIGGVTKVSSTVYDVVFSTDSIVDDTYEVDDTNYIASGDYVQVTVKKLGGVKTQETIYHASRYARNTYRTAMVGEEFEEGFGFSQSAIGYISKISVSGVPSGLTAKVYGQTVYVSGTPKEAKASVMTFSGVDELGRKLTQKVNFYIGSPSVMLCYIETENTTILANDDMSEWFTIHVVGGSGDYTYSLNGNSNKWIILSQNKINFDSYEYDSTTDKKVFLKAGKYTVPYTVKDDEGHSCSGKLVVNAVNGVTVSGKVTAADNSGIKGATVYVSMEDEKHLYYMHYTSAYSSDEGDIDYSNGTKKKIGEYKLVLYPSELYDFHANKGESSSYVNAKMLSNSNAALNFRLPLYKVNFSCGNDYLSAVTWKNSAGRTVGYGETVYCKKGSYNLTGKNVLYEYTANFTVNGNVNVNVKRTKDAEPDGTLTEGEAVTTTLDGGAKLLSFKPAATGSYQFKTSAGVRITMQLYDAATGKELVYRTNSIYTSDADGNYHWEYGDLTMKLSLTAGNTYYVRIQSDDTVALPISVTQQ